MQESITASRPGGQGWSGNAPTTRVEAIGRILDATEVLAARNSPVTIADVARALGVTRQTVYRYFPNTDAILIAVATRSTSGFLYMVEKHLRGITRPTEAIVEAMAFAVETLAGDDRMNLMLSAPASVVSQSQIVSTTSIASVRAMLERLDVDWPASGFDEDALTEMAEFILRLLYSYLIDRNAVPHDGVRLRRFLARWAAPAVAFVSMADAVPT